MKNKWILFGVALIIMTINLLRADFSVYVQLSPAGLLPVLAVALMVLLIKTGILSALLIGIKELLERIKRK